MKSFITSPSVFAASLLASALLAAPVHAQDALGGGDALDANLSTSGRFNAPRAQEDFRQRNNIVTGNVAGGRGFRGTVGYTAERDFRGAVGSDSLFRFLADSAWSDPQVYSFGPRYDQLRFGQTMGVLEYNRPTTVPSASLLGQQSVVTAPDVGFNAARVRINQYTISQSQSQQQFNASQPRWVSGNQDQFGNKFVITASPARGFTYEFVDSISAIPGLTTFDRLRLQQDKSANPDAPEDQPHNNPLGSNFQTRFTDSLLQNRSDSSSESDPFAPQVNNSYKKILEQVAQQYTQQDQPQTGQPASPPDPALSPPAAAQPGQPSIEQLQKRYEEWRNRLQNPQPRQPDPNLAPGSVNPDDPASPSKSSAADLDDFSRIISHQGVIDRYSADRPDRFNELLAAGESQLRSGQYFQAERTFVRALQITPDHPVATAGMAHAQLGAGVFATASASLRALFTSHPEMIDARYAPQLIPADALLNDALLSLQASVARSADVADNSLLIAYIGRLLNQPQTIQQGLASLKSASPDDPLPALLEKIWLKPASPSTTPADADSQPASP